jgi:hypothetical protein
VFCVDFGANSQMDGQGGFAAATLLADDRYGFQVEARACIIVYMYTLKIGKRGQGCQGCAESAESPGAAGKTSAAQMF